MVKCLSLTIVVALLLTTHAAAQPANTEVKQTANPELVGTLAKELGATPKQAEGAAGSLFNVAKSRLKPEDWSKVAGSVPGMDGLLKAAPDAEAETKGAKGAGGLGALSGAAGLGGLQSAMGAFSKLGLKPELVAKAVPVLTNYVSRSGGSGVGQLLAGALK
jgi:Protein of unknown function VcgC/VcgE (DUF2780)